MTMGIYQKVPWYGDSHVHEKGGRQDGDSQLHEQLVLFIPTKKTCFLFTPVEKCHCTKDCTRKRGTCSYLTLPSCTLEPFQYFGS